MEAPVFINAFFSGIFALCVKNLYYNCSPHDQNMRDNPIFYFLSTHNPPPLYFFFKNKQGLFFLFLDPEGGSILEDSLLTPF